MCGKSWALGDRWWQPLARLNPAFHLPVTDQRLPNADNRPPKTTGNLQGSTAGAFAGLGRNALFCNIETNNCVYSK